MPAADPRRRSDDRGGRLAGAGTGAGLDGNRSVAPTPGPPSRPRCHRCREDEADAASQQVGPEVAQIALVGPQLSHHPADRQERDDERAAPASQPRTTARRSGDSRSSGPACISR